MANHIFPQPSVIKSIQAGIITIPHNNTSATATINAVNTTKSVVLHGGTRCPGYTSTDQIFTTVQLTNATTVTATVGGTTTSSADNRYVAYTVLEFY
jgi:hypothetical protein